ncbi:TetR/AcrR family transcriptional regulator [Phreatobacter stygius]|uniref:TetR/AcrR family transcriptional regulator n=1 Tax=Phreatobacter stygius TaxID=1940610 RepID=A0A4D7B8U6_9HYPH|nr:TetR/AcrR family transcriptional regulator [Phreatobacter stygius]QCI67345.1 TetR/AcrR family transcriptional regulator [Phreatobacter stygius]
MAAARKPKPKSKPLARRASVGARRNPDSEAAVLAAARGLLAEKGYAGFSIDEVARRAGAGKPTIYRWWPTKADLFIAVYAEDKAASIAAPDTGSLARDLAEFTRALWGFWRETPSGRAFRALVAEAQASQAALDALRVKFLPERIDLLRHIFARAAARGEIDAADIETLLALYIGFNWFHLLTGRVEDEVEAIERMARIIVRGGGAGPTRAPEAAPQAKPRARTRQLALQLTLLPEE